MSTQDPTGTKTLRADFESECYHRFRDLKGDIREAVVRLDVLDLGAQRAENSAPDPERFRFLSNPEKREQFQAWLRTQIDDGVLEPLDSRAVRRGEHYSAQYVKKGYEKGVTDAGAKLRAAGVDAEQIQDVGNHPVHASKLEQVYTRTYDGLEGITQEMDTQISRELSDAIANGYSPDKAARNLNDRVDTIGITRARTLSQTEIINAHATGALDRYESAGFAEVEIEAEYLTANDSSVCPKCESLHGNIYSIADARELIPHHPGCRCTVAPSVDDD